MRNHMLSPRMLNKRFLSSHIVSFILLLLCIFVISDVRSEVKQVIVVSRHCDRTPISYLELPNDPINWKKHLGLSQGQLTGLGISQCETMGHMLKDRYLEPTSEHYISGITQHFDSDFFKFHSTAVDRTIISLNSVCQGLFPNGTGLVNDITNKPSLANGITVVPVHTIPEEDDILLRGFERCPTIDNNLKDWYLSQPFLEIEKQHNTLMQTVANLTGTTIRNFQDFYWVYDVLMVQKSHNLLHIPKLLELWNDIYALGDLVSYQRFTRNIQANLGAGPLIDAVFNSFDRVVNNRTTKGNVPHPKYIHYSAHDSTLESIFATLGIDTAHKELQGIPPYGSQLIFELHRDPTSQTFQVQVVIRLGYNADFVTYRLGQDKQPCSQQDKCEWKEFTSLINKRSRVSVSAWCTRCGNDFTSPCAQSVLNAKRGENTALLITVPVVVGASLIVVAILLIISLRHRKRYYTALA